MIDEPCAQRSDTNPRPRRKLEILGDPAVEQQSFARIARVDEFQRVADLVEALFIKRIARQLILPPVSGRNMRAAQPRFHFSFVWYELQLYARCRHPYVAWSVEIPRTSKRKRRGFRRTE